MNWIYKFYRVDPSVEKDSQTKGRFTFNVYYYFQPVEYENWAAGNTIQNMTYSAELITHPDFPKIGTHLEGALSGFYIRDILSIENLNEEDNAQAVSYAVITCECENTISKQQQQNNSAIARSSASFSSNSATPDAKPWEKPIEDFTVTPVAKQVPFISGYFDDKWVPIVTTANQNIQGITTDIYTARITWTYLTNLQTNYSLRLPVVNEDDVQLNTIYIPAKCGLLMPPSMRKLWYFQSQLDTNPTPYYSWSFEIILDWRKHLVTAFNAGTCALDDNGNQYDICAWYIVDPSKEYQPNRKFGPPEEMIKAKKQVQEKNELRSPNNTITFTGDFVQDNVPLTKEGKIDYTGMQDPSKRHLLEWYQYRYGKWNLGGFNV